MRTLVKFHRDGYGVLLSLPLCDWLVSQGHTVAFETLPEHRQLVELTEHAWKDPQLPWATAEGARYDAVYDLDSIAPNVTRACWWDEAETRLGNFDRSAVERLPATVTNVADYPMPEGAVLICPLDPREAPYTNAVSLERAAKRRFPGARILWWVPGNAPAGPGREQIRPRNYTELAGAMRAAKAVIACNGITATLATATYRSAPVALEYVHAMHPARACNLYAPHPRSGRIYLR